MPVLFRVPLTFQIPALSLVVPQNRPIRWRWSCKTIVGDGSKSGDIAVQLQPQRGFKDERELTQGLGVGRN
jgi:hypothetical protein